MQTFSRVVKVVGMAVLLGTAIPAFAESAPVFDADNLPSQFDTGVDNGADQGDLPPPPPPQAQAQDTFVPLQQQVVNGPAPQAPMPAAAAPAISSMSLDQRMKRVEQQVNNLQTSESVAHVDSLQTQVQSLHAQVEQLTHQLQQAQSQQKSMYADLDNRLTQQSASKPAAMPVASPALAAADTVVAAATVPVVAKPAKKASAPKQASKPADNANVAAAKTTDGQPNVAEEQQIYQTAYNLIKAKKYNDAVTALQTMLQKYPSGQFASNAHYWLGELYGLMGKNDQALTEFSAVLKTYPGSPRVSDAQLKVGLIYATQLKWSEAKTSFKKVINHYPGTASARLAQEQLKQIKLAGH